MVILFFTDCIESFVFSFRFISVLVPNSQNLCLLGPSWTLKVQTLSSVRDRALLHLWMLRCNYRRSSIKCKYRAAILFFCLKTVICSIKVCLICSLRKIVWDKIFNKWLFWLTPPDPVLETVSSHWKLLPFEPARKLSLSGICETVPQVRRAEGCNCECLKMWEMIMPSWPSMGSNLRKFESAVCKCSHCFCFVLWDRFPHAGIQIMMMKIYNHDKTLIESTSETPHYPWFGGGWGGGGNSYPRVHFVHETTWSFWRIGSSSVSSIANLTELILLTTLGFVMCSLKHLAHTRPNEQAFERGGGILYALPFLQNLAIFIMPLFKCNS